jgi:hypothetical protein
MFCNTQFVPVHHQSHVTSLINFALSVAVSQDIPLILCVTSVTFVAKFEAVGVLQGRKTVASVPAP